VLFNAESLLSVFGLSGESMRRAREHLVLLMCFMPLFVTNNVTSGFLQGAGDVGVPAAAGLANLSARLVCSYVMARTFVGFRSVYWSMPAAQAVCCVILITRWRSGAWRNRRQV
jgi:Na+-driven multidrug efflux pump